MKFLTHGTLKQMWFRKLVHPAGGRVPCGFGDQRKQTQRLQGFALFAQQCLAGEKEHACLSGGAEFSVSCRGLRGEAGLFLPERIREGVCRRAVEGNCVRSEDRGSAEKRSRDGSEDPVSAVLRNPGAAVRVGEGS